MGLYKPTAIWSCTSAPLRSHEGSIWHACGATKHNTLRDIEVEKDLRNAPKHSAYVSSHVGEINNFSISPTILEAHTSYIDINTL